MPTNRNEYMREYREKNRKKLRDYNREYNKKWREEHGYHNEANSKKKYPEKQLARQHVHYAVKVGKLVRKPCEVCGEKNTQAHHDDYSKHLVVKWFCALHHTEHHKKLSTSQVDVDTSI